MTTKITYTLAAWATQQREVKSRYNTNAIIGAVDTFCRLKAFSGVSSCIHNWRKRKYEIALKCEISTSTLMRRLTWLHDEGWIDKDRLSMRLQSWFTIHEHLGIAYDKIFFELPNKINNERRTFYWIYLAEIQDNKNRQAYMIIKKLNKNHELKAAIYAELKRKGIDIVMCEKSTGHFLIQLQNLYIDSFRFGSEIHDILVSIRPDTNRSCIGLGKAWTNENHGRINRHDNKLLYDRLSMQASYVKKKMVKQKVAVVQQTGTIESDVRSRNKDCYVMYNKAEKSTFQAFCDDIITRQPIDISNLQFVVPDAA